MCHLFCSVKPVKTKRQRKVKAQRNVRACGWKWRFKCMDYWNNKLVNKKYAFFFIKINWSRHFPICELYNKSYCSFIKSNWSFRFHITYQITGQSETHTCWGNSPYRLLCKHVQEFCIQEECIKKKALADQKQLLIYLR